MPYFAILDTSSLSQYGLAGLVIGAEAIAVIYLNKRVESLTEKLLDVQEARRLESLESSKELMATMSTFSQSAQLLIDKILAVKKGR